jgi:hypothetical protein
MLRNMSLWHISCEYNNLSLCITRIYERRKNMRSERFSRTAPVLEIGSLKAGRLKLAIEILTENVDLGQIDTKDLDLIIQDGYEAGEYFTYFLKTTGKSIIDRRKLRTIRIDRKRLFNPAQFMDHQGLEIEEQDKRSVMITEIDSSTIALESMLEGGTVISGEEHLRRLKQTGYTRLDAGIFQTFWENQHLIPEYWKGAANDPKHIFFDGTILRNQYGRYVISLYWSMGEWRWTYCRLDIGGWKAEDLSAVIRPAEPMRRVERRKHNRVI